MNGFSLTNVLLANFQPSVEADKTSEECRKLFGFSTRYKVARLAIGRSLGEETYPLQAPDSKGRAIKGDLLFGVEEHPLWISLLVTNMKKHNPQMELSISNIQNAVKRHWVRGVKLLYDDWEEANGDYQKFVEILITRRAMLPDTVNSKFSDLSEPIEVFEGDAKPVYITVGTKVDENEEYKHLLNGVGYSPHVAIMGQAGSGKTRIMLNFLEDISKQTSVPVILLDLGKGDLAQDQDLIKMLNASVIEVPNSAIPLDMFHGSSQNEEMASDIVLGFRDSFASVMQSRPGGRQLENIKTAIRPLFANNNKITLNQVRDHIQNYYTDNGINTDTVISTISDLTERIIFNPELSPAEFFSQNWIVTFSYARDTIKNLATSLLLDSLNNYMKRLAESTRDQEGNRAIRLVLAIDEARHLLDSKHKALSENIRLHRSKGLVVFLASQSPDDYEGAVDDYLENIGLPVCFKTNANSTQVLKNMFKSKPNFSALGTGECLTLKDNKAIKVKTF